MSDRQERTDFVLLRKDVLKYFVDLSVFYSIKNH